MMQAPPWTAEQLIEEVAKRIMEANQSVAFGKIPTRWEAAGTEAQGHWRSVSWKVVNDLFARQGPRCIYGSDYHLCAGHTAHPG